jgi:hypothetical protein
MEQDKKPSAPDTKTGRHEHPLRQEIQAKDRDAAEAAHKQADHDMEEDVELSAHSPNDDLDEGETARLGDDENALI